MMKKLVLLALFILGLGWALFNFKGLANQGEFDSIIINFREDIPKTEVTQQLQTLEQQYAQAANLNSHFSIDEQIYILEGDKALLQQLRQSSLRQDTEYIEPNYLYHTLATANDPDYPKQWNLKNIAIESAWDATKGKGVTVAVIDTGITPGPDLQDTAFVEGYDFVNNKIDASDDHGHGTHVAGTIAQTTNNRYGVAGVAYQAKLMPLKVLSAFGGGTTADIAEAIRFAADHGADVINMSLGGGGDSQLMKEAIDYAYQKGVVLVAAAGNENRNASSYPARYPRVISVSALDINGERAPYSNYGAGVDIAAPGGSEAGKILQETIDPSTGKSVFREYQGTSMAAPHVAGVAALIKASGVTNPEKVAQILQQSSQAVTEDSLNYYGAGHLNAADAVNLAHKGKLSWYNFFRWLRENGYMDPRFWFDGGVIFLLPKLLMVLGAYLLSLWFSRTFVLPWNGFLHSGLVLGSSGLFILQGFYIFDLPQWPFRLVGSSWVGLGNAITGSSALNPIFASALIPLVLLAVCLSHPRWKWFAIGSTLGVASCLGVNAWLNSAVWGLGDDLLARGFLIVNLLMCLGLAYLASKAATKGVSHQKS